WPAQPVLRGGSEGAPEGGARRSEAPFEFSAPAELEMRKEVRDLEGRGLGRVGAVHGVRLDRGGEIPSDGAGRGLRRIGRAHEVAPSLDGVVALEHHRHARRSEEHTSELQSLAYLVCRLL